ncbi:hypothetical protein ACVB3T_002729, partial [Escherichia coli]
MEQYDQIGARLDRLPLARFHYRIFGIISFSLLLTAPVFLESVLSVNSGCQ